MDKCNNKQEIDLSCEISSLQYFKSSFARSMAVDCMNQTKSLDSAFLDRPTVSEKRVLHNNKSEKHAVWNPSSVNVNGNCKSTTATSSLCNGNTVLQNGYDLSHVITLRKNARSRSQSLDAVKLWKVKQDKSNDLAHQNGKNCSDQNQNPCISYTESDVLRLRKECQSLLEENRRLQATLELRSVPLLNGRSLQVIDNSILQSRVDTLQWQLKQTESSRQMYRAVMEQVVRFLERAYKNLDLIKNKMDPTGNSKSNSSRVPRSRSVHTVDVSPTRESPRPQTPQNFPRAKSIAQIESSPNYSTFRDFTWRRPRQARVEPDEVPPEKLSQEAFRLLRTVQSLLNTREPDLVQRLCPEMECETVPDHNFNSSHRSSLSSSVPGPEEENSHTPAFHCSNIQKAEPNPGSCNSLLRQSLESSSFQSLAYNNNSSLTSGLESAFAGGCRTASPNYTPLLGRPRKCKAPSPPLPEPAYTSRGSPPVPQLSVSSTEDESGFSSMNSFQEVGLPLVSPSPTPSSNHPKQSTYNETQYHSASFTNLDNSSTNYNGPGFQELGLPVVDLPPRPNNRNGTVPNHRRWSSSPAETLSQYSKQSASCCGSGETLRVLWV